MNFTQDEKCNQKLSQQRKHKRKRTKGNVRRSNVLVEIRLVIRVVERSMFVGDLSNPTTVPERISSRSL